MHSRFHLVFLAALVSALAGCAPHDPQPKLAMCIDTSTRNNPRQPGEDAEENHDTVGAAVVECMKAAGYRHDLAGERCIDDVDFNPGCYVRE